jgi:V/A-type H+-transporting ATPase subunit I
MIVPMHKYSFLVFRKEYEDFLNELIDLGVLHIKIPDDSTPFYHKDITGQLDKINDLFVVLDQIKMGDLEENPSYVDHLDGKELLDQAMEWLSEAQYFNLGIENLENELNYAQKWGAYDAFIMKSLVEHDVRILFYTVHERDFDPSWEEGHRLYILSKDHPFIHFVVILHKNEISYVKANPSPNPPRSIAEIEVAKVTLHAKANLTQLKLKQLKSHGYPKLQSYQASLKYNLNMTEAIDHSQSKVEDKVILLEGFVPITAMDQLEEMCEKKKIVFIQDRVTSQDQPPILLKNNYFASLFEPLGSLYSLPAYREMDMTPFFAPFFMLFFGFCLGDAGYGLVILLATFIFKNKMDKQWLPVLILARYLSLATIIFGILTGTLFGINLLEIKVPWLMTMQNFMINSNQAFNLALILGLVQIVFGLILKSVNNFRQLGILYSIGPLAWILLLLSLGDIFITKITGGIGTYLAWTAVGLILFFSSPEGNIFARLGAGVWELYGITGFVGDLLSYIRLFALGISGAILGMVINDIALRMLNIDYIGWLLFIVFLIVGHSANLLIASLGSFVHPLRLTFVEFYKNAGFTGGGKPYKPFGK